MKHLTLYRQYRPQKFSEIIGQEHIVRTLQNAIRLDRVAHAYLFFGPRGTGKTTMARLLAKSLNCEKGPIEEPCDECSRCKQITQGTFLDLIEIDAASTRGIEEIRDLREKILFTPVEGNYRIYIIDEVHMLTAEAFNAFLKTLEEPPSHSILIMATTEIHRIPPTIASRCQRFEFRRLKEELIIERIEEVCIKEKIKIDKESSLFIAKYADGSLRDALSLLEQVISFSGKEVELKSAYQVLGMPEREYLENVVENLLKKNLVKCLEIIDNFEADGKDFIQITKALIEMFKDFLISKLEQKIYNIKMPDLPEIKKSEIMEIINILIKTYENMRYESQKKLFLEVALISIAALDYKDVVLNEKPTEKIIKSQPILDNKKSLSQEQPLQSIPELNKKEPEKISDKINLTLENIKARWKDFLLFVKKEGGIPLTAYLNSAVLVEFKNSILGLKIPFYFDYERIKDEKNFKLLEKLLESFFEKEIKLNLFLDTISKDNKKNIPQQKKEISIEDNEFLELFPGSSLE